MMNQVSGSVMAIIVEVSLGQKNATAIKEFQTKISRTPEINIVGLGE
jgi:hypothetical protein